MPDDKFEKFWERVWISLFHILGIAFVLGFIALIIWGIFQPESELSSSSRQEAQKSFNTSLLSGPAPCAIKHQPASDLSSVFNFWP